MSSSALPEGTDRDAVLAVRLNRPPRGGRCAARKLSGGGGGGGAQAEAAIAEASEASGKLMDVLLASRAAGDAIDPQVLAALEELPPVAEFDDDAYDPGEAERAYADDAPSVGARLPRGGRWLLRVVSGV